MLSRFVGTVAVGVLIIAGVADYASAFNWPIRTKMSLIKPGRLYKIVSRGTFPLPAGDLAVLGGSLTVTANSSSLMCTLAARPYDGTEGWKGLGDPAGSKGWRYLNKMAPAGGVAGACRYVLIKENVIKVLAKSSGGLVVNGPAANGDVAMQLIVGGDSYCAAATPPYLEEIAGTLLKMRNKPPFKDNGDGTISECTGLMWEKKDNAGGIHDVYNVYTWAGCCDGSCSTLDDYCQPNAEAAAACSAQTGGAVGCSECSVGTCETGGRLHYRQTIWEWLVQVNAEGGTGFAGHCDWRMPSEDGCNTCYVGFAAPTVSCPCDSSELESILLRPYPCRTLPCIDPIFGPTVSSFYWSSTTKASTQDYAWFVHFYYGLVSGSHKGNDHYVRAVRGGSPSAAFLDVTATALD
jgi:hypothetical protein